MTTPAKTAENAEKHADDADPFPPEGTDEKVVRPDDDAPISEDEAVKATEKAIGHK